MRTRNSPSSVLMPLWSCILVCLFLRGRVRIAGFRSCSCFTPTVPPPQVGGGGLRRVAHAHPLWDWESSLAQSLSCFAGLAVLARDGGSMRMECARAVCVAAGGGLVAARWPGCPRLRTAVLAGAVEGATRGKGGSPGIGEVCASVRPEGLLACACWGGVYVGK